MLYEPIGEKLGVHYLPQGYFGMQTEAASDQSSKAPISRTAYSPDIQPSE